MAHKMTEMLAEACFMRLSPPERERLLKRLNRAAKPARSLLTSSEVRRHAAERLVEALIEYVDEEDGDPDAEPEPDEADSDFEPGET